MGLAGDWGYTLIWYETFKQFVIDHSGITRDALHIHVSIALFFVSLWITRRRLGSFVPVIIVLGFCILGEISDNIRLVRLDQGQWPLEHLKDIANTMVWPVLFTAYGRWRDRRRRGAIPDINS